MGSQFNKCSIRVGGNSRPFLMYIMCDFGRKLAKDLHISKKSSTFAVAKVIDSIWKM